MVPSNLYRRKEAAARALLAERETWLAKQTNQLNDLRNQVSAREGAQAD